MQFRLLLLWMIQYLQDNLGRASRRLKQCTQLPMPDGATAAGPGGWAGEAKIAPVLGDTQPTRR
jgi:hypothetical protein